MESKTKKRSMVWMLLLLFFLSWTLFFCMQSYPDNDFYNMASAGRWVVEHGIMRTNPFFVEKGWPTVLQQWPYAAALYQIYAWFGIIGLNVFVWIQGVIMASLGYAYMRIRGVTPLTALCCAPLFCLFMAGYINCRPEMLSNSLILIQLISLEKYAAEKELRFLLPIPLVFWIEANVHTTFWVFHVLFLLPYCFRFRKLQNRSIGWKAGLGILACSVPLVFLNVYGARAALLLFHSGSVRKIQIGELLPIDGLSVHMLYFLFGVCLYFYLYRKKLLNNVTVPLFFVLSVLYLAAQRCMIQFSLVLLIMMADAAVYRRSKEDEIWAKGKESFQKKKRFYVLSSAFLIGTALLLTVSTSSGKQGLDPKDDELTPVQAAEYLLEHEDPKTVKLFTNFNNGGYMTWHGFENIYIEPKTEPYLQFVNGKKDVILEYSSLKKKISAEEIEKILAPYDFDYFIVDQFHPTLMLYMDMSEEYEEILPQKDDVLKNVTRYKLYKKVRPAA